MLLGVFVAVLVGDELGDTVCDIAGFFDGFAGSRVLDEVGMIENDVITG